MTNARNTATIRSIAKADDRRGLFAAIAQSGFDGTSQERGAMNGINTNDSSDANGHRAEDRIRIVLKGLSGQMPVGELCRREGISTRLYYQWCLTFLEAGKTGLRGNALKPAAGEGVFSMAC